MARDPTTTTEYKEQKARFEARQASGHWTGKTKARRDREAKARADKKKSRTRKGIEKAFDQGSELDKLLKQM